jgi:RecB family exonuclease
VVDVIGSYAAGLDGAAVAADRSERDARDVYRTVRHGGDPTRHGLAVLVGRGWEALSARRSARFTEWDGNLSGEAIAATDTQPLSASRLERWATCGFRYYLSHLLGLAERDDPERIIEMSALDKGSGVHAALERFLAEVLEGEVPPPHEPWSDDARARLAAHAANVLDEYEARGRTGRAIHWNVTRAEVLALLDSFLDADNRHRSRTAARPERVELPFGLDDAEPVRIELPDGRVLAFRGRADRVDRSDDGTLLVLDYKSGRGERYRRIDAGDPVQAGTTLQLGLYAEAAMQHLGAPSAEAHYWMIDTTSRHPRHGYAWTEPRRARFLEVVTAIADGIEAGHFPAVPGEWSIYRNTHDACVYCDFDRLCPHDRGEMAEVKLRDPVLRGRAVLANFDPDGAGGAGDGPA